MAELDNDGEDYHHGEKRNVNEPLDEDLPDSEQKNLTDRMKQLIEDLEKRSSETIHWNQFIASIFYLSVIVCIGIPIWLRTTTPERWPLPDISQLMVRSQTIAHHYKISIVILDLDDFDRFKINRDRLRQYLRVTYSRRINFDNSLSFQQEWNVREAFPFEKIKFKELLHRNHSTIGDFSEIDQSFSGAEIESKNAIIFFILPSRYLNKASSLMNVGRYRSIFIDPNHLDEHCRNRDADADLVYCLGDSINDKVIEIQSLVEHVYSRFKDDHQQNIALMLSKEFHLIFDIIFEKDEVSTEIDLDERNQRYKDFIERIDRLIETFYTHRFNFSEYFHLTFITQVLHFVFPNERFLQSKLMRSNETIAKERLLPLESIETILNKIESSRVEHDNEKSYHLVLYVRSESMKPLKFLDTNTNETSILISTPFRGSFLILNNLEDDLNEGFRRFVRNFFFLPKKFSFDNEFFTQLEIESIVHALIQRQILETLKSLESIEKLLIKVNNMVIEEKIATKIQSSLDRSMEAADYLQNQSNLLESYRRSSKSFHLSEEAFFDPSLLSLLYFPEDQKYAIYLPLFLPICIPLFNNLRFLFKTLIKLKSSPKTIKID
ncbi:GPI transamidase component PIG-S-like protein [Sarcoptes scabiei]|uniref:GPI transamidase component PIG-S-like protein n=1 Tax=Sarcoptes scabiei TaxID=52283 RepID=A0A132A6J1_SARSC|nr:GPI transamidase component PIG-S-like protein [Sarcoptes scabiei]